MGRGDNGDHALPTQSHPQGHFVVTDLQSLTELENSTGGAGRFLLDIRSLRSSYKPALRDKSQPTFFSRVGLKARTSVCFSPGLMHLRALRRQNGPWISNSDVLSLQMVKEKH